jgi:hypothetical protein
MRARTLVCVCDSAATSSRCSPLLGLQLAATDPPAPHVTSISAPRSALRYAFVEEPEMTSKHDALESVTMETRSGVPQSVAAQSTAATAVKSSRDVESPGRSSG